MSDFIHFISLIRRDFITTTVVRTFEMSSITGKHVKDVLSIKYHMKGLLDIEYSKKSLFIEKSGTIKRRGMECLVYRIPLKGVLSLKNLRRVF